METLGGADTHARDVGRRALRHDSEPATHRGDPRALPLHPAEQRRRSAARARHRSARPARRGAARRRPGQPEQAVRHARRASRRVVDDGEFYEVQTRLRGEHHLRLRAPRRVQRRHRREPAGGARRRARHQRLAQGGAVHPLLRRVQHSDRDLRGRAGLPAGRRPRSTAASSSTARSCCSPTARRRCPS